MMLYITEAAWATFRIPGLWSGQNPVRTQFVTISLVQGAATIAEQQSL